ncbi:MAG: hypothetical protein Q8R37_01985 [Nanoarchaeota archaeon]|nr:hypothetical protein [Nanoarchaeota archaeon]
MTQHLNIDDTILENYTSSLEPRSLSQSGLNLLITGELPYSPEEMKQELSYYFNDSVSEVQAVSGHIPLKTFCDLLQGADVSLRLATKKKLFMSMYEETFAQIAKRFGKLSFLLHSYSLKNVDTLLQYAQSRVNPKR